MFEYALSFMIFLPILAGLALLLLPLSREGARIVGFIVSVAVLFLGIELFLGFAGTGAMEYVEKRPWIESLGISYSLGVDGISLMVLMAGSILFPMVFTLFAPRSK